MSAPWISTWSQGSLFWISSLWRASWQGGLFILLVWAACRWLPRLPAATKLWRSSAEWRHSTRGRIHQMIHVELDQQPITDSFVDPIDKCLDCGACDCQGVQFQQDGNRAVLQRIRLGLCGGSGPGRLAR